MKLKKITLENFRSIKSLSVSLDPALTVIIGRNGAGKTSILDAIAMLLKPIEQALKDPESHVSSKYRKLPKHDVRDGAADGFIQLDYVVSDSYAPSPEEIRSASHLRYSENEHRALFSGIREFQHVRPDRILLMYYRQDRGFNNGQESKDVFDIESVQESSLSGDFSVLKDLAKWWDEKDAKEARIVRDRDMDHRDPELEAIRKLIKNIDSFEDIHFSSTTQPSGLYFEKSDGSKVHVDHLSSGERSFIILLADLARRLQVISPDKALEDIPGIILIDEIELNLHPAWQAEIVPTLRKVFKSCQFVITTHSPKVLSEVNSINVRALHWNESKGEMVVETPLKTKGRSTSYLLQGVFRESDRSKEVDILMDKLNHAIDTKKANDAKKLLRQICDIVEGEPLELYAFKNRLKALEAESEG